MTKEIVIKSYKGFDKNMKCRGFQYEVGKEYECDAAKVCEKGFHACEYPLDIFIYYYPATSVFHEVEQSGEFDRNKDDSKIASTKIKIGAQMDVSDMIKAAFEYITERCTNKQEGGKHSALQLSSRGYLQGCEMSALQGGDYSALRGGDQSALQAGHMSALQGGSMSAIQGGYMSALQGGDSSALRGGDHSALQAGGSSALQAGNMSALRGGYMSALQGGNMSALRGGNYSSLRGGDQSVLLGSDNSKLTGGKYSVVYGCGHKAQVRGGIGSVLALAEFDKHGNIIKVHVKLVDGEKIKADTYYTLKDGEFVEVK